MRSLKLLLLSACAFKESPKPEPTPCTDIQSCFSVQSESGMQAEVKSQPKPHAYTVELSWPEPRGVTAVALRRRDQSGVVLQLDMLRPEVTQYEDLTPVSGSTYKYDLLFLTKETVVEAHSIDVKTPVDFVVQGVETYTQLPPETYRVFLTAGSRLITGANPIDWKLGEFVSKDAVISSFEDGAKAPTGVAGLSAPAIQIESERATGQLHLLLNAQVGGDGVKGSPGGQGGTGATGRSASAQCQRECWRSTLFDRDPRGPCSNVCSCTLEAGDGGQGGQGLSGGQGTPGLPGGSSAAVFIQVITAEDFEVTQSLQPGAGGRGGPGGDGGPGGPGGSPGSRNKECNRRPSPGPYGPWGNSGPLGPDGPAGHTGHVCLKLSGVTLGDCSMFKKN